MSKIGVFDSGFGGLSVLQKIKQVLPEYDLVYLGDSARAPYGNRSFDTVHEFTLQAVERLFRMDCSLVILACNTASAKSLRNIQQVDLPKMSTDHNVLGVIRPITESVDQFTKTGHIGIFATEGTVKSNSYGIEISKFYPQVRVSQEACPMWVPLIENHEHLNSGADFYVKRHIENLLNKDPKIDAIILGCTHYPLMMHKIRSFLPETVEVIAQGEVVAEKLKNYLLDHPNREVRLSKNGSVEYYTTDDPKKFNRQASYFLGGDVKADLIHLS